MTSWDYSVYIKEIQREKPKIKALCTVSDPRHGLPGVRLGSAFRMTFVVEMDNITNFEDLTPSELNFEGYNVAIVDSRIRYKKSQGVRIAIGEWKEVRASERSRAEEPQERTSFNWLQANIVMLCETRYSERPFCSLCGCGLFFSHRVCGLFVHSAFVAVFVAR